MKLSALLLACSASLLGQSMPMGALPSPVTFNTVYSVAVDRTKMGSSTLSNFPVELSASGIAAFKLTGNGGAVTNAGGYDIVVATDTTCSTYIPWEVEYWDGTAGTWIAWANLPSVNGSAASSNTTFAVCAGKRGITTQQNTGSYATTAVWSNGFVGVYHFANGLTDSTSYGNSGTGQNAPTYTSSGQIAGAISLASASAQYVSIPGAASLTPGTGGWTIGAWCKTSTTADGYVMSNALTAGNPMNANQFAIEKYADNYARLIFADSSGDVNAHGTNLSSNYNIGDGNWHYVVAVYNPLIKVASIYVDGVDRNDSGVLANYSGINLAAQVNFGRRDSYWNGQEDEARIVAAARTPDWILSEYHNQLSPGNVGSSNFLIWSQQ